MKINIDSERREMPALWFEDNTVTMINQSLLPHKVELHTTSTFEETADAIRSMIVRGAPTIGAAAAFGLVQAVRVQEEQRLDPSYLEDAYTALLSARPTAVDLKRGLDAVWSVITDNPGSDNAKQAAFQFVKGVVSDADTICNAGLRLMKDGLNILTHCNTGPLAVVDHGTALGPMLRTEAEIHVWVDETRPRLQGARLTMFELQQAEVASTLITDNAAASLMRSGEVDLIIVGADRVAKNGDFANKIGTYSLAVLAKHHEIPFYTAWPSSTFDQSRDSGAEIPIEEREISEVTHIQGKDKDGKIVRVQVPPDNVSALNLSFDVTPYELVTGHITPHGILEPGKLREKFVSEQ